MLIYYFQQNRAVSTNDSCVSEKCRKLFVFDFDHTVVDDNTDIVVRDLVAKEKIPSHVTLLYKHSGWIPYMQEIFNILKTNNIERQDIHKAIEGIPEVNGMKNLLQWLGELPNANVIIISDSNSQFINHWCTTNDIRHHIDEIFTNPAHYTDDDALKIQPYHNQNWCKLSSVNLCKGQILEDFMKNQQIHNDVIYENVFYFGDGANDFCPILRLKETDYGCVRKGYRLEKEMKSCNIKDKNLKAEIFMWNDAVELMDFIKEQF